MLFFDKKPASELPWTTKLWVYDLRTNQHFTLKQNPLRRHDRDEFVDGYLEVERVESERWMSFTYDELMTRDKVNLDIIWLVTSPSKTATIFRRQKSSLAMLMHTCAEFERSLAEGNPSPWPDWTAAADGLIDGIVALMQGPVTGLV